MISAQVHPWIYWPAWVAGIEATLAVMVAFWEELMDGLDKTIRFLQALVEICKSGKRQAQRRDRKEQS